MSIAQQAMEEADSIVATIIGVIESAVHERRQMAEWYYAYRSRRAAYARTKVARRYWLWLARRSRAMMEANRCCRVDDLMAKMSSGGIA